MDQQVIEILKDTVYELKKDLKEDIHEIKTDLSTMKDTLIKNHENWVEHRKRTDLNEDHVHELEKYIKALEDKIEYAVRTIEPHIKAYDRFIFTLKMAPFIFLAGSTLTALLLWTGLSENTKTVLIGVLKNIF
jgi:predicted  nucleic acid-binding Zn-ribbon protein